jgi:putative ABC transport system ATP-binding protein
VFQLTDVRYKNILDIPSLDIPPGKITCIIGESGSGKTTLLRLLNQLISQSQGRIIFADQDVLDINPVELRRQVVMLPQDPFIFPGSIEDNLQVGLRLTDRPLASPKELQRVLELVHLRIELAAGAAKLSGGEKQRLGLARVILMEPKVYLLDEPSAALDEDTEDLVIRAITGHVQESGQTLIMVTHSKRIAREYGQLILELSKGNVIREEV